ncbi:hypothetical protein VTP01DRAFT_3127 [Rhizomucor pusillus]|uniref:uncharacterized protein n=1 Tax=Rhizomucor pusillus TaxID=4840 RepID=UPI0037443E7F
MPTIPESALPNLHRYKYGGVDKSLTSRYILTPFWNNLVKIFPLWIAPNVITLLGLCCVFANVATLFYYAPDLGPCPNWVYLTFAAGLFAYQSLDAIDGKQARRTGMSGPLGELFDHGCDALNTTLGVLTWASATYLGQSWWTVASLFASLSNFYLSTWEEYHTGILYLGYFSGPVEGVLMLVGVHLISGIFGPAFWTLRVEEVFGNLVDWMSSPALDLVGSLQLNHILIVIGAFTLLINAVNAIYNVIHVKLYPTDFSHPDRSIAKALLGLVPYIYMSATVYIWMRLWPSIVHVHLLTFMLAIGLVFGHQVGLMITAHVAKLEFPWWNNTVNLILATGCTLAFLDTSPNSPVNFDPNAIVNTFLLISAIQYASFIYSVINEICNFLGIRCFVVKKKITTEHSTNLEAPKPNST